MCESSSERSGERDLVISPGLPVRAGGDKPSTRELLLFKGLISKINSGSESRVDTINN